MMQIDWLRASFHVKGVCGTLLWMVGATMVPSDVQWMSYVCAVIGGLMVVHALWELRGLDST